MKKIGIFYICTGPYIVFWEDFYKTSEQYFLPNTEKHYFIFTDSVELIGIDNPRVHVKNINNMPWPLITLLRFHYFISIEDQLNDMDYLMFSNSNMKFVDNITEDEFLPREDEELFVTHHPGYLDHKCFKWQFERNPKSTAYLPYNYKGPYVIGAMEGGTKTGFLKMSHELFDNINSDLKINRIARWHDESHINKYIAVHKNYIRLLTPNYCYPYGFDIDLPKKIIAVGKQDKFNVNEFKGYTKKLTFWEKVERKWLNSIKPYFGLIIDTILCKKVK